MKNGRNIPNADKLPAFCYVLSDLTPSMKETCKNTHDLIEINNGLGYWGYKKNANAFVEVISYDQLLITARERNRAFFSKLGLPSN